MKSHLNVTRSWKYMLGVAVAVLAVATPGIAAEADMDKDTSFEWSAELVALDEATNTITVKSLIVGREMTDWDAFDKGDRVVLTWSGITSATGVRYLSHEMPELENARLTMPVEFVSVTDDHRYVTYRVALPASEMANIKALETGAWITATSPYEADLDELLVESIRPYTAIG